MAEIAATPDVATAKSTATVGLSPHAGVEVEFRFSGLNPAQLEAMHQEVEEFEALTGIKVIADFSDWTSCLRLPCPIPDIWHGGGLWIPPMVDRGHVLELDDYVATWDEWEDFYPNVRADVVFESHSYGIPYRTNYRGSVVIRPSLFAGAGLAPEPPSTWEELNELAPKLTVRDGEKFDHAGFNLQHHTQVYEDFLTQAGGTTFSADLASPLNNTPEGHLALTQHVRHGLVEESMPKEGMDSGVPNLHAFCAGRVAIQMLWPGNVGNCETNAPDVFADISVGPPLEGPRRRAMQLFVDKYMVWAETKHPDAVFETLKYFVSPEPNYKINIANARSMPCRAAMEDYELYENEPYKSLARNIKYARIRQVVPEHFDVQPAMSRWVEKAGLGELSVSEALRGMDKEVQEIVDGA